MNRSEALHALGLEEGATQGQIKAAYKETAQILHPDRFAGNKKLQNRATEQFKRLQDAYATLTGPVSAATGPTMREEDDQARIRGIRAARVQLVAERDAMQDRFRAAGAMLVAGLLAAVLLRRLVVIAGIGAAVAAWGLIDAIMLRKDIDVLDRHIAELKRREDELERKRG